MKRIFALLALFVITLSSFAHDVEVDGIYYNLNRSANEATVTNQGSNFNCYSGNVTLPSTITVDDVTYSITTIGKSAFFSCTNLSSVNIPNSVTTIGKSAFYSCTNLSSVNIPNSVTTIEDSAFEGCYGLSTVIIPNSVTIIGTWAFSECSNLTSVTIGNSVTTIERSAFYHCRELNSVTIGYSVTRIDQEAFAYCNKLETVTCLADDVPTSPYAFQHSDIRNTTLKVPEESFENYKSTEPWSTFGNILPITGTTVLVTSISLNTTSASLTVGETKWITATITPSSATNKKMAWSSNNTSVAEVSSSGVVTAKAVGTATITCRATDNSGKSASCSVTVTPSTPVEIGGIYYELIPGTKEATVTFKGSSFDEYDNEYSGSVTIPSTITVDNITYSVTAIGYAAFAECSSLTSVTIPNSVTTIEDGAFYECSSLSAVSIPNSVTKIGIQAFYWCTSLNSVTLGNSIITIGENAFWNCIGITSITFPNSVETIKQGAFGWCTGLISVTIPNCVTTIAEEVFRHCSNLTSVTIGNSVSTIGEEAFYECTKLTSVTIPNSVKVIGRCAFQYCSSLTSAIISNSVTTIGNYAFANCWILKDVTCLAKNVPSANTNVFENSNVNNSILKVPASLLDTYKSTAPWKSFGTIESYDYALVDGTPFNNAEQFTSDVLTYTRTFSDINWQALYVPFSMQYDDWKDDFEIARLNDVHQFDDDEDGEIDRTVLESVKLKAGSVTEANTPYMIKAKTTGAKTITLNDATVYPAEENSFDVTSWYTKFTFTGTYHTVTDMATTGHYAMAKGGLMQATSDAATLGSFRWYLDVTDRNGNPKALPSKAIRLSFDDGETTDIDVINAESPRNTEVYTISGMPMNSAQLPKGVYISNGKKVVIK